MNTKGEHGNKEAINFTYQHKINIDFESVKILLEKLKENFSNNHYIIDYFKNLKGFNIFVQDIDGNSFKNNIYFL